MGDLTPDNPPVPPRATQSVASMPQSEETNVSNLFFLVSFVVCCFLFSVFMLEVGGWRLKVGCWKLVIRGWRLEIRD